MDIMKFLNFPLIFGLIVSILTIVKPSFFWNSRKATRHRDLLGDTITSILYLSIGIWGFYEGISKLI
ncbi:hypothetical protein CCE28_01410 [Anaeromicrobium sediminis]|uniref:Uncharacterized protein n=1 Tax=Anaeromicrobium sediminis TaxID=1478221 RepID=A0A267MND9_9FIRM|nr:hypothetical protein CCE28_01410 [Anaeromicrobium sediminis]